MTWRSVNIADVCESIIDCVNKTAPVVDYATPFKMIRTTNVRDGWVKTEEVRYVDEQTYRKWTRRQVPQRNDVILTREAPLGEAGIVRTDEQIFLGQRLVSYRANPKLLDPHFLLYSFLSREMKAQILALGSGSTVAHMRVPDAQKLELRLAPLPTQRRIAGILAAYDDLIENNTKRIKILEEMARALYREWFVHFRFPGHEKLKLVDSPLGQIPEGWQVVELRERIELAYGKALKKDARIPGAVSVYGSSGVVGTHNEALVEGPGIVVGRKGNVGSVFWSDGPFYPIDTTYFVRTSLPLHYVYFNLQYQNFLDSSAAVPGLSRNQAYALPLMLPTAGPLEEFARLVSPMFGLHVKLERSNELLRETRDLLLPRLISGEIDVDSLDLPEAAQ